MSLMAGLAAGAMGIGNSALGYYQGLRGEQLSRDTNALNYQMWQQQLDYDKPVNQVARLKEAGLNPALMYGTGSGANVAPSAPRMEAPAPRKYNLDPGIAVSVQQARLLGEQARALKLENDQTEATPGARRGDTAPVRAIREGVDAFRNSELGKNVGSTLKMMQAKPTKSLVNDAWDFWGGPKAVQKAKDLWNRNWFFGSPKGGDSK